MVIQKLRNKLLIRSYQKERGSILKSLRSTILSIHLDIFRSYKFINSNEWRAFESVTKSQKAYTVGNESRGDGLFDMAGEYHIIAKIVEADMTLKKEELEYIQNYRQKLALNLTEYQIRKYFDLPKIKTIKKRLRNNRPSGNRMVYITLGETLDEPESKIKAVEERAIIELYEVYKQIRCAKSAAPVSTLHIEAVESPKEISPVGRTDTKVLA